MNEAQKECYWRRERVRGRRNSGDHTDKNGKGNFFLGNLFPKYEELVPFYEVNYFFPFLQGKLTPM